MPALILCVDDQEISLQVRQKVLASVQHEVVSTTSAGSALQLFLSLPFDLVVLNNSSGDTTGVVAQEMKRHKTHVPIKLVSGATEMPHGYEVCDHFIHKTSGPENLLECVDASWRKGRKRAHERSEGSQSS